MKITKQVIKDAHQLTGMTKEKIYALLGGPDHSEFGGIQLKYFY